jgi:hypothetical protein
MLHHKDEHAGVQVRLGDRVVQGQFPHEENFNAAASHCPTCGAEYRRGFTVCADDGTELKLGPAPEHGPWNAEPAAETEQLHDWPRGEPPVAIARQLLQEAHLVAGRLQAEGIPAIVDPVQQGGVAGKYGPDLHDVLVPRSRVRAAADVLGIDR